MRYFIIFNFIVLPWVSLSQPVMSCVNMFSNSKSLEYKISLNTEFKHPYSKQLFLNLYTQIESMPLLYKKEKQDKKLKQEFILKTEEIINFIESHPHNPKLKALTPKLLQATEALPAIFNFVENQQTSFLDTKTALKVVVVALTRYTGTYLKQEVNHLDWARLDKILSSIADFNTQPTAFSLYKILRSVREKHSLWEFINCR